MSNELKKVSNGLVPIYQNDNNEQLVSARELHEKLGSKQQFTNWIQNRIEKYDFVENEDYLIILLKSPTGKPSHEYALKLDVAKEIAMVENSKKGKQIRRYFIEAEKKLRETAPQFQIPKTMPEALRLASNLAERKVLSRN